MTKIFIPANYGMSKKQIWNFMYDDSAGEGKIFDLITGETGVTPQFTADQIPDEMAQEFVDDVQNLVDEGYIEEDLVSERQFIVEELFDAVVRLVTK